MADTIRNEFYRYGYEHPDMMGCVSDALARNGESDDKPYDKNRCMINFDLLEIRDDLDYKHRTILKLIREVRKLRKELSAKR